jgi:hypothetical protein
MPGQRAKNKVRFGGYVDRRLHGEIVKLARKEGMERNVFGFAVKLIQDAVAELEKSRGQSKH